MSTLTRMPRTQLLTAMALVIVIAELFANDIIGGDADVGGWISLSLFGIAVMLLLVLVLVPRIPADKRRAWTLGLGVAAVITCAVFWSALPFALAAATFVMAAPGEEHPGETGEASASAGVILAALATIAAFIFCIIG
jgi:Na+/melibiose symporter-like transporter